jgi:hypothetical protein
MKEYRTGRQYNSWEMAFPELYSKDSLVNHFQFSSQEFIIQLAIPWRLVTQSQVDTY